MSSIIARHTRLVRAGMLVRSMHASSAQLTGRKKAWRGSRLTPTQSRTLSAELDEVEDTIFEDEEDDNGNIEEMQYDDHHTAGHLLLESIRDVRKYMRQAEFEIPTLAEHAKPFTPPSAREILHFERSVTIGEEYLAQDRKVLLRLKVSHLGLKGAELHKFILLAGERYNPETDELKMSEKRESTSLMNKKRLADTLVALITEAKNSDDTFKDVPLDFSYRGYKPAPEFPKEWLHKRAKQANLK